MLRLIYKSNLLYVYTYIYLNQSTYSIAEEKTTDRQRRQTDGQKNNIHNAIGVARGCTCAPRARKFFDVNYRGKL